MSALGTLLGLAAMGIASVGAHRGLFHRSRRPSSPSPEWGNSLPLTDGACGMPAANTAPRLLTHHQSDESRRWHLERAEAKRIRRAYRKMRHDIDSRLDNPAWKHSATGRSA